MTGSGLTHVDAHGAARMVDVSAKEVTAREATARGRVVTTAEVVGLLAERGLPKGDALAVARIAGISAAKKTSELIPLCHPIALHGVTVGLELGEADVTITATTRTADRTGVEMEALTAVTGAALALYDMIKAVDRSARITDIELVHKSGGRRGSGNGMAEPVAVITCSNRSAAGARDDTSGALLADLLGAAGFDVTFRRVVPDDIAAIRTAVAEALAAGVRAVVTTGGTGITPTDVTPEAVAPLLDRELPGIADAVRMISYGAVPTSVLSRGVAGTIGRAVVVTLPGSNGGVRDGMKVLGPVLAHALDQLGGGDH